ncbi:MAG TPA: hypothetical protein ENI95_11650 [Chloroflexi bacterium]|nr:hypothetical protein [Chloroflexota bacterium]
MTEENVQPEPSEFVEHMRAAGKSVVNQWKSLIPREFWQYGREARREFLLAMRSLVDSAIERLETEEERPARKRSTRKAKIEVE